jgi:hypothetical protein
MEGMNMLTQSRLNQPVDQKKVVPDFKLVELDETHHWSDEVQARGRVYGVYLVDMNRHTYCCELTPSLELIYLYSNTEAKRKKDDDAFNEFVTQEEMVARGSECTYVHVGTRFDRIEETHMDESEKRELAAGEITYEALVEEMREYYIANHHL